MTDTTNPKQLNAAFTKVVSRYLDSNPALRDGFKTHEFEIRFSGGGRKPFTKIHFDNVVKHLYSAGFETQNADGHHMLRVIPEHMDRRSGVTKMSTVRAEIHGMDLIQEYCRTNDLKKLNEMASGLSNKLSFTQKISNKDETGGYVKPVDFADFNFRISHQLEQTYGLHSKLGKDIVDRWTESKKIFRLMNRIRFSHPVYPVYADLSIVKSSRKSNRVMVPEYTIQDAGVFTNPEEYEIELEINNVAVGNGTMYNTTDALMDALRKSIRVVLSGLQGSNYPISNTEQSDVLQEYMQILNGTADDTDPPAPKYAVSNRNFIGPGITTLQVDHVLVPTADTAAIPNIRNQYCVTEKADGDRKLLFIGSAGRVYLIDTNMNVIFTGMQTENKVLWMSILDGEHIKYDSKKRFIDLYTAFDIYYIHKVSVRELPFLPDPDQSSPSPEGAEDTENRMERGVGEKRAKDKGERAEKTQKGGDGLKDKFRLVLLNDFVSRMDVKPVFGSTDEKSKKHQWKPVLNKQGETTWVDIRSGKISKTEPAPYKCKMRIQCKNFAVGSQHHSIFEKCAEILSNIQGGQYEYLTDGLIFTPINTGVGSDRVGVAAPLRKITWDRSFKWKPVEQNTVDFLVSVKKDKRGKDEIHNIFQEGRNLTGVQDISQYKTVILRCGFSEKQHGYLNPCADIIHDRFGDGDGVTDDDHEDTYRPEPFYPTNPYDMNACVCNIMLRQDGSNTVMMTEEGEYFEEDMVVEFRYEMENEIGWRWVPLRVRYDKTGSLRAGAREYGNAYHVANSNWHSLHNPVTESMIRTGEGIPTNVIQDDVYYNRMESVSITRGLRDFHNRFVKDRLIGSVSNRGDILIDYAVGAAGDLSKWIRAKLGFVFGMDLAKDNIYNKHNSACARYLEERKKRGAKMPYALFVNGNSVANIREGKAFFGDKDKEIARAIFGNGPKDAGLLGKGVYRQYGVAQEGFHVSSAMFCMHYFFENLKTFLGFMRNLAECTRLNGYFIGTCYDGKTVFKMLEGVNMGNSTTIMKQGKKIHEIEKAYDFTSFPDNDMSLGYKINVYYETINHTLAEYLVNFTYMTQIAELYGFVLVSKADAENMGLPNGTGMFSELYSAMESEAKQNRNTSANFGRALYMTAEERAISFLNRFFVFRKVMNVNTEKITKRLMQKHGLEGMDEEMAQDAEEIQQVISEIAPKAAAAPKARKSRKPKIALAKYSPVVDSPEDTKTT